MGPAGDSGTLNEMALTTVHPFVGDRVVCFVALERNSSEFRVLTNSATIKCKAHLMVKTDKRTPLSDHDMFFVA